MKNLYVKGISVMKFTRESSNAQIPLVEKQNLVRCAAQMGATHIEITMYTPDNASLVSHGFIPSPRSIEDETKQWYDVIHAQPNVYGSSVFDGHMKVLDRPVFPESEGLSGYAVDTSTPIGTAAGVSSFMFTDDFERGSIGSDYVTNTVASGAWSIDTGRLKLVHAGNEFTYNMCRTALSYGDATFQGAVQKQSFGRDGMVFCVVGQGASPFYRGYAVSLSGSDTVILERLDRIEETPRPSIATDTSLSFTTGNFYNIKVDRNGSTIKVKVWDVNTSEPVNWLITATEGTFTSGTIGFSTEGFDKTILFDSLSITSTPNPNSTWVGRYRNYLYNHVGLDRVQTGDIHCPFAEITGHLFTSPTWTNQAGATACVTECHKVSTAFATEAGKTIIFLNNPNWTEIDSGYWGAYTDTGYVCYDCYGTHDPVTPEGYVSGLTRNYNGQSSAGYGIGTAGYPQAWLEWGDLSGAISIGNNTIRSGDNFVTGTTNLENWESFLFNFFKAIRDGMVNTVPQKLKMFNWWGGWGGQNTSVMYTTGSSPTRDFHLNWRGQMLRNFYVNDGMERLPVITNGVYTEGNFGGRGQDY